MRGVQDLLGGQLGACLLADAVGAAARLGARVAGDDRRAADGVRTVAAIVINGE
jgi:hypothetical protein